MVRDRLKIQPNKRNEKGARRGVAFHLGGTRLLLTLNIIAFACYNSWLSVILLFYDQPLKENRFRIPKSRYDSIDSYLSERGEKYNDTELQYDPAIYQQLRDAGK